MKKFLLLSIAFFVAISALATPIKKGVANQVVQFAVRDTSKNWALVTTTDSANITVWFAVDSTDTMIQAAGKLRPYRTTAGVITGVYYFYSTTASNYNYDRINVHPVSTTTNYICTDVFIQTAFDTSTIATAAAVAALPSKTDITNDTIGLERFSTVFSANKLTGLTNDTIGLDRYATGFSSAKATVLTNDTVGLGRSAQFTGLAKTIDTTNLARSAQFTGIMKTSDTANLARSAQFTGIAKTVDTAGLARSAQVKDTIGLARTSGIPTVASIQSGLALDGTVMHKTDTAGLARTASTMQKGDTAGLARTSGIPSIAGIQSGLAKTTDTMAIKKSSIIAEAVLADSAAKIPSVSISGKVVLAANQTDYAPAKAGDTMAIKLTSHIALMDSVSKIPAVSVSVPPVTLAASQPNYAPLLASGYTVAPTTSQIDSQLTATKGSGPWGSTQTYANTITMQTRTTTGAGIPSVPVSFKNGSGTGLQLAITDVNGNATTTLPDGAITVLAAVSGYSFRVKTVTVSGNGTIIDTGTAITVTSPIGGAQTVYFGATDLGLIADSTSIWSATLYQTNQATGQTILTSKTISAKWMIDHFEFQIAKGSKVAITGKSGQTQSYFKVITITNDATKALSTY